MGCNLYAPAIEGIIELEGKGVSYCAVCDGFFYRKKNVAVIGNGTFAVAEASHLAHIAESVTILTDGKDDAEVKAAVEADSSISEKIKIDSRKVTKVIPNEENTKVGGVTFADGESLALDGVFVALGSAGAADFAKKLGSAEKMVDQKAGLARLWGNDKLPEQIDSGMTEEEIRATWLPDVEKFLQDRKPYLIYK